MKCGEMIFVELGKAHKTDLAGCVAELRYCKSSSICNFPLSRSSAPSSPSSCVEVLLWLWKECACCYKKERERLKQNR